MALAISCKAVLLDIEGTTTSISFVKDTLFPYVTKNCESYLTDNWDNEDTKKAVQALVDLSKKDVADEVDEATVIKESEDKAEFIAALFKNVQWQMSKDRKSTELKQLQGLIWKKAYADKSVKGHVYEDVAKNFESWTSSGLKLYIFSSGSVDAQKLLFANTTDDDLSKHLTGYYDTKIGPKQESDSYQRIAKEIGFKEDEIVFFTDVVKEAEAAKKAGYKVALLDRPGNAEIDEESKKTYSVLKTFDDVKLTAQTAAKRKNEEVTEEQVPSKIAKQDEAEKVVEEPAKPESEKVEVAEEAMEVDVDTAGEKTDKLEKPENVPEKVVEEKKQEEKEAEKKESAAEKKETESEKKESAESEKPVAAEPEKIEESPKTVDEKTEEKKEIDAKTEDVPKEVTDEKEKEKEKMEVDGPTKPEESKKVEEEPEKSKEPEPTKPETKEETTPAPVEEEKAQPEKEKEVIEKPAEKTPETDDTNGHDKKEKVENGSSTAANGKDLNGDSLNGKTSDENETIVAPKETVDPKSGALVEVDLKKKQVIAFVPKEDTPVSVPPVEAES